MSEPAVLPRLTRTVRVQPSAYQIGLAILKYEDGTWALAIEYWYRGQKLSAPHRVLLPEAVALATLEGNPITDAPYRMFGPFEGGE